MGLRLARYEVLSLQANNLLITRIWLLVINILVLNTIQDKIATSSVASHSLALLLLTLFLFGSTLLVDKLPASKLLTDFLLGSCTSVSKPRVCHDIGNSKAHVRLLLEHASDEVHELWREVVWLFALRVGLPEQIRSVGRNERVEPILIISLRKGRVSSPHDEQDNSKGKKINHITLIRNSLGDFWGHVAWSTDFSTIESRTVAAC